MDSAAPLAARRATAESGALCSRGTMTPWAPAASALRRQAPRLCGSCTPSSTSSSGIGGKWEKGFEVLLLLYRRGAQTRHHALVFHAVGQAIKGGARRFVDLHMRGTGGVQHRGHALVAACVTDPDFLDKVRSGLQRGEYHVHTANMLLIHVSAGASSIAFYRKAWRDVSPRDDAAWGPCRFWRPSPRPARNQSWFRPGPRASRARAPCRPGGRSGACARPSGDDAPRRNDNNRCPAP